MFGLSVKVEYLVKCMNVAHPMFLQYFVKPNLYLTEHFSRGGILYYCIVFIITAVVVVNDSTAIQ